MLLLQGEPPHQRCPAGAGGRVYRCGFLSWARNDKAHCCLKCILTLFGLANFRFLELCSSLPRFSLKSCLCNGCLGQGPLAPLLRQGATRSRIMTSQAHWCFLLDQITIRSRCKASTHVSSEMRLLLNGCSLLEQQLPQSCTSTATSAEKRSGWHRHN
jgi:hypothetical protein